MGRPSRDVWAKARAALTQWVAPANVLRGILGDWPVFYSAAFWWGFIQGQLVGTLCKMHHTGQKKSLHVVTLRHHNKQPRHNTDPEMYSTFALLAFRSFQNGLGMKGQGAPRGTR